MSRKRTKNVALGTLLAAGLGYAAGILTAPKSGKETRKDIQKAAIKAKVETEHKLKDLNSELNGLISKGEVRLIRLKTAAKKELASAIERAQTAKEKSRSLLTALHEGDSVDSDLDKAVKEAKAATDHLKNFLSKHEAETKKK
jgi:gas vesicle protein